MRTLSIRLFASLFVAAVTLSCIPVASAADCDQLLKTSVSDPHQTSGITGSAELCIDGNHATVSERTQNLISGHAYTTWFAYIDDPTQCGNYAGGTPGVCADPDAVLPAGSPVVVFWPDGRRHRRRKRPLTSYGQLPRLALFARISGLDHHV